MIRFAVTRSLVTLLFVLDFVLSPAQSGRTSVSADQAGRVRQMAYEDSLRLVSMYKDLHQNPELGFMEVRTAGIIAKELQKLGFSVVTGIGKTGLAGILRNGSGPVVMYRADMDCNSVREITGLPYASTKTMKKEDGTETPVMHACGHDAHVTWMLGVAKIMVALKSQWKGTLVFLGQPAEEPLTGARAMVADSLYERGVPEADYLFALHTWPIPVGTLDNAPGVRFSGSDQLDVTFHGIGGHGSSPEVAKDPIVMASAAVMQYQTIISRQIGALDAAVLTVGAIHAGVDNNVIPPSAELRLNLRWFNDASRKVLLDGIRSINEGIAVANQLPADKYPTIRMKGSVSPLVNDSMLTARVNEALSGITTPGKLYTQIPTSMGSEDFQHLIRPGQKTVYNYIRVGTAHPDLYTKAISEGKRAPYFNHNGNYQVDLAAIPWGTQVGATAVLALFRQAR